MKTGRKSGALWLRQNLVGMKFGRLTVVNPAPDAIGSTGNINARWNCVCECGKEKTIQGCHLRSGATKSCGCIRVEKSKQRFTTHAHGSHDHRKNGTYTSWSAMKTRCTNPNQPGAPNYIGRGITICDRWMNSFENFLEDMGERPSGYTIERINNNLGY